jgi:RimJ/RimL family protein N-acetyltransferase
MPESERLLFRRVEWLDEADLAVFLRDPDVMYAWGRGFSGEEVRAWIAKNRKRYEQDGMGFLFAARKGTGRPVGVMGLIYNRDLDGVPRWEIAYILKKECWGRGYAREGAKALARYALTQMKLPEVYAQMRVDNGASEAVAKAVGMEYAGTYERRYFGMATPHHIYVMRGGAP